MMALFEDVCEVCYRPKSECSCVFSSPDAGLADGFDDGPVDEDDVGEYNDQEGPVGETSIPEGETLIEREDRLHPVRMRLAREVVAAEAALDRMRIQRDELLLAGGAVFAANPAAVELGARAIKAAQDPGVVWDDCTPEERDEYRRVARACFLMAGASVDGGGIDWNDLDGTDGASGGSGTREGDTGD